MTELILRNTGLTEGGIVATHILLLFKRGHHELLKRNKNKLINIRQHNKRLLDYTGYMFRPVNRSKHVACVL